MTVWKPPGPVLMTADPVGGVWTYALELCRELGRRDVSVVLATTGRRLSATERSAVERLGNVRLFESAYKLEWMREPWDDLQESAEWLLELAERMQPALVHLNAYCYGALPWRVPCLVVGHSCVYSWYAAARGAPPPAEWEPYRKMVSAGLRGGDRVTAPSRFMLNELERHYGAFSAAEPVYNGRSASEFGPAVKDSFAISVGRLWDAGKNAAILSDVARRLRCPLYAAGDTAGPDGVAVPLAGPILLGRLAESAVAEWLSRAAVFTSPARYEPFGLSALEAALSGCALVLSDIPSFRELWDGAALFVAPEDADGIAAAITRLIDDGRLRRHFSLRARRRAASFTAERMAENYLSLYQRMLSEKKRAARDAQDDRARLERSL